MIAQSLDAILDQLADAVAARVAARLAERIEKSAQATEAGPDFYTETEVSKRTGISRRTLQSWRSAGRGPTFVRAGAKVLYPTAELKQFLQARRTLSGARPRKSEHPESNCKPAASSRR